ncbi:2Fe-2S iron-sulfur cluster-binding protein [Enterovibrio paralichthyis]|uniref:2Fe-2S iron-sulfur cluster-binding protein n=1 Tax=Enterovibrio paralichthyis TaxID=2853805 RepID=UPI001C44118B|nr:2Fe-2S iron-sulfur cluster-binding protein [Enterovibrio paralichthyis]MBV7300730.1 2Fe-2S iron-sulfur cluster binding domain-containing protein [Enterovibrio paralichthyis]
MKVNGKDINTTGSSTALDAVLNNHFNVAHECKNGVCGACRCKASGKAKQVKDAIGYHGKGEILLCTVAASSDIDVSIIE